MQGGAGGAAAAQARAAADTVARLSAMLASAAALVVTEGSLTEEERRSCCLDAVAGVKAEPAQAAAVPGALPFGMPQQQQQQQFMVQPGGLPFPQQQAMPMALPAQQQQQAQLGAIPVQSGTGLLWPAMQQGLNGPQHVQQQQLPPGLQPFMLGQQGAAPMQQQQQQLYGMVPPAQQGGMPAMALAQPGAPVPLLPGVTQATVQQVRCPPRFRSIYVAVCAQCMHPYFCAHELIHCCSP